MTNGIFDVAVLVGSLRKESFNLKLAKAMTKLAPQNLKPEIVEIRDLPLYNEDSEASVPPAWTTFRDRLRPADAFLFVTPEYNRSVPGVLKNAIDVGSRPYGKSVFSKKPAAVASLTGGALGAFGANHHLRQMFVFLDMPPLQQPELYLGGATKMFDAYGNIVQDSTRELIVKFLTAFAGWIETTRQK
jgi:chromate reductase, NAD(P)H dehydrogenase (quinone)